MSVKTRGSKSSERKACYHGFFAGFILALVGIHQNVDLTALGVLIGTVVMPLMWFAGARTAYKLKHGETEE